jgi:hypothetical protein
LTFSQAPYSIDGLGTVHWAEPEEEQVGVEISALDPSCVALVRDLVIDPSARGYIPRSSAIQG